MRRNAFFVSLIILFTAGTVSASPPTYMSDLSDAPGAPFPEISVSVGVGFVPNGGTLYSITDGTPVSVPAGDVRVDNINLVDSTLTNIGAAVAAIGNTNTAFNTRTFNLGTIVLKSDDGNGKTLAGFAYVDISSGDDPTFGGNVNSKTITINAAGDGYGLLFAKISTGDQAVIQKGATIGGTLTLGGDIDVTAAGKAVGVYAGYAPDLFINNNINATGTAEGYGILLDGNNENKVTITNNVSITGTTASIAAKNTGLDDRLYIDTGTATFNNHGKRFVVEGIEKIYINSNTVLGSDSAVNGATGSADAGIYVANGKTLTSGNIFDDGTSEVRFHLNNYGTLVLTQQDDQTIGGVDGNFRYSLTHVNEDTSDVWIGGGTVTKTGTGTLTMNGSVNTTEFNLNSGTVVFKDLTAETLNITAGTKAQFESAADIAASANIAGTVVGTGINTGESHITIWDNAKISQTGSIDKIRTLTVKDGGTLQIAVRGGTAVQAEKLDLQGNAKVQFTSVGSGTYSKVIQTDTTYDADFIEKHFSIESALIKQKVTFTPGSNNSDFDVSLNVRTINEYFKDKYHKGNAGRIGTLLDKGVGFDPWDPGASDAAVAALPSFVAGEAVANGMSLSFWKPYRHVFRHLDRSPPLRGWFDRPVSVYPSLPQYQHQYNAPYRGQSSLAEVKKDLAGSIDEVNAKIANFIRKADGYVYDTSYQPKRGFEFWAYSYGTTGDTTDNDREAIYKYQNHRTGSLVGSDLNIDNCAIFGTMIGYGQPVVEGDAGKVKADDFTFGMYLRTMLFDGLTANVYIGWGVQDYDLWSYGSKRYSYDGHSTYGSVELSKQYVSTKGFGLRPFVAAEWQGARADEFTRRTEYGTTVIMPEGLDQVFIRMGIDLAFKRLQTRFAYAHQVDGAAYGTTFNKFKGTTVPLYGVNAGGDWFNAGLSGAIFSQRGWLIYLDGDIDASRRTCEATGSLRLVKYY